MVRSRCRGAWCIGCARGGLCLSYARVVAAWLRIHRSRRCAALQQYLCRPLPHLLLLRHPLLRLLLLLLPLHLRPQRRHQRCNRLVCGSCRGVKTKQVPHVIILHPISFICIPELQLLLQGEKKKQQHRH